MAQSLAAEPVVEPGGHDGDALVRFGFRDVARDYARVDTLCEPRAMQLKRDALAAATETDLFRDL